MLDIRVVRQKHAVASSSPVMSSPNFHPSNANYSLHIINI